MARILSIMTYSEFIKLIVCISFDGVEYLIPFLLQPLVGDLLDIIGLISCVYMFKWMGLFAILELIPSFDVIPINVIAWIIWYLYNHRQDFFYRRIE